MKTVPPKEIAVILDGVTIGHATEAKLSVDVPPAPGAFNDTTVRITESFTAAYDGSRIYATEKYRVFSYDNEALNYLALEVDGAGHALVFTDAELIGRAEIIADE